jgi:sigma-B regulation protein RsbU (phosphoserine phosphatase)
MYAGGSVLVRAVVFEARERRSYEADLLEATRAAEAARSHAAALAQTLQQTLIPPTPPRIQGLTLAAAYRPAGDGLEVGGDFYDVFQVGPEAWMVVIGDVSGKGIPAATLTSFVRHTVRALAIRVPDPAELLADLDAALLLHPTDRFCTLAAIRLDRGPEEWVLTGCVGGHPLPLLRDSSGVRELGVPGPLIGVLRGTTFASFHHVLQSGQSLVLFTDGITEGRHQGELYGMGRLLDLVRATAVAPAELTECIVEDVLAFQHGTASDDIAVVTLTPATTGPPGSPGTPPG